LTRVVDVMSFARMSYVLEQTKQQQVLTLGQLGWTVSRIAAAVRHDGESKTQGGQGWSYAEVSPLRGESVEFA